MLRTVLDGFRVAVDDDLSVGNIPFAEIDCEFINGIQFILKDSWVAT